MRKPSLPPGFRFHPTDVELVKYHLKRKVLGKKFHYDIISEVDIYKHEPWDLPEKSCLRSRDLKWYFFCSREKKYGTGGRMNRSTDRGYWKTTGKDRPIHYRDEVVGMIKTLVFHVGKAPRGDRTDWVMHEYRLQDEDLAKRGVVLDAYVLCVIFQKDGLGPRNGTQYGAPFVEEEWTDDEEDNCVDSAPSAWLPSPTCLLPVTLGNAVPSCSYVSENLCTGSSSKIHTSETRPSAYELLPQVPENDIILTNDSNAQISQVKDTDILTAMEVFSEDVTVALNGDSNEKMDGQNSERKAQTAYVPDGNDIYLNLGDLDNYEEFLNNEEHNICSGYKPDYPLEEMFSIDDVPYLELNDLDAPLDFPDKAGETGQTGDCFNAHIGLYDDSQLLHGTTNSSNNNTHVPGPSVPPVVQPEKHSGFCYPALFQKEIDTVRTVSQEYEGVEAALHEIGVVSCYRPELGSEHAPYSLTRGKSQRTPTSRLISDASALFYGGSSITVKAEVTRRGIGSTKDALSNKVGESLCVCYGSIAPCSGSHGFPFVFVIGRSSIILCFFIAALNNLGGCFMTELLFLETSFNSLACTKSSISHMGNLLRDLLSSFLFELALFANHLYCINMGDDVS